LFDVDANSTHVPRTTTSMAVTTITRGAIVRQARGRHRAARGAWMWWDIVQQRIIGGTYVSPTRTSADKSSVEIVDRRMMRVWVVDENGKLADFVVSPQIVVISNAGDDVRGSGIRGAQDLMHLRIVTHTKAETQLSAFRIIGTGRFAAIAGVWTRRCWALLTTLTTLTTLAAQHTQKTKPTCMPLHGDMSLRGTHAPPPKGRAQGTCISAHCAQGTEV